jgi:miniconductance mechanosensitive channel
MMEPASDGIPVEVYCFTAVTAWVEYERIQGDIFDHLLAVLPELGLRLYQQPSGADFGALGSHLRENAIQAALAADRDRPAPALPDSSGAVSERGLTDGKMPT